MAVTLDGVTFQDSDWLNRGHLTTIVVNGTSYKRWEGMWVAGIDEINTRISGLGGTLVSTSTTEATIGAGAQSLTVQASKGYTAGMLVEAFETGTETNYMVGTATAYDSGTGVLAFTVPATENYTGGSGTISTWTVRPAGRPGPTGSAGGITGGTLTGSIDADGYNITGIGTLSATTATVTTLTATTAAVTDLTVSGLTTIAQAGENAEGSATNVTGDVILQATGAPVLRHTLTGDVTYLVAGAPTPGKGWQVEVRPTQDGTGGRAVTILPVNELPSYSADLQSTAEAGESRPWGDDNTSLDDNAAVGPDGLTTMTKLIEDASTSTHSRNQTVTGLSPNQTVTATVIIKDAEDGRNIRLFVYDADDTGNRISVIVNPATGVVVSGPTNAGNATGATATVTALANSCFRVDITGHPNTSGSNCIVAINLYSGTTGSYLGNGTSGVYIGEIQVNAGSPVGIAHVGATRAGQVVWRTAADEIDFAAQAASTASRILISYGSDGEILVDDVSLVS